MTTDPTALLYELGGLALIVPSKTGVVYRTQSGGHSCYQTKAEGYVVPLAGEQHDILVRLHEHFTGPKWGGWCSNGIDDETADFLENILVKLAHRENISVARARFVDSWESWVHVRINGASNALIENATPTSAILTWPNSD